MAGNRFPRDSDCRAKNAACAGIKYPTPQPRPVIKYKLHRREERDRGRGGGKDEERKKEGRGGGGERNETCTEREEAIGWKYDSTLSDVPRKFTTEVIDIGAADSLLRAAARWKIMMIPSRELWHRVSMQRDRRDSRPHARVDRT